MKSYGIQFLSGASILATWIFVPKFAQEHGASDFQVGLIFTGYGLAIFVSSIIFGRLSDNLGRKPFLLIGLLASAACFTVQGLAIDLYTLFIFRALAGFSAGIFPASLVAYVHEAKKKMGRFSSAGALGWGSGVLMGGVVAQLIDTSSVFFASGLIFLASFLIALRLPSLPARNLNVPRFPKDVILRNSDVYIAFLIRHSGAHSIWVIFPLYLDQLGANSLWIGIINAINAFGQAIFMYKITDRVRGRLLINIGLLSSMVTFILFAAARDMWQIMPAQILLAFSWACLFVGSLRELTDNNEEKATAVGILNSIMSMSMIFGAIIGTFVVLYTDYRGTLRVAACFAAASWLFWTLRCRFRGMRGRAGECVGKRDPSA